MLNKDLEIIKKKYGENMMKLCRKLFPSILEEEGVLSKIILSNFYPNHNLYDDIIDNKLENNFKNYNYNYCIFYLWIYERNYFNYVYSCMCKTIYRWIS